jgi:hypothetical protein
LIDAREPSIPTTTEFDAERRVHGTVTAASSGITAKRVHAKTIGKTMDAR